MTNALVPCLAKKVVPISISGYMFLSSALHKNYINVIVGFLFQLLLVSLLTKCDHCS